MIRAAVFDFGGTLDTDGVHWSEKFWEVYERLGLEVSKADYERAYVVSGERLSDGLMRPGDSFLATLEKQVRFQLLDLVEKGKLPSRQETGDLARRIASECYRDVRAVMTKSRRILDRLKGGFSLGLVSNFLGNLEGVIAEFGLEGYFRCIVDSALVGVSKPDPAIFEIALKELDVKARDAAVVGDSYDRDIVPAKKLGCLTVWVFKKSWNRPKETGAADFTVDSISRVPRLLLRRQSSS